MEKESATVGASSLGLADVDERHVVPRAVATNIGNAADMLEHRVSASSYSA